MGRGTSATGRARKSVPEWRRQGAASGRAEWRGGKTVAWETSGVRGSAADGSGQDSRTKARPVRRGCQGFPAGPPGRHGQPSPGVQNTLMHVPPFSIFSAVSELFVTAGVIYVIRTNWMRRPFNIGIFLTVALFE